MIYTPFIWPLLLAAVITGLLCLWALLHFRWHEITALKRIEQELADTKALLEAAFIQTPIPMTLISSPDHVIRIGNPAMVEYLGLPDEPSIVGMRLADLPRPWIDLDAQGHNIPLDQTPLMRALNGIVTHSLEMRARLKDGMIRWGLISASPIYNQQGKQIAAYLAFTDITTLKQAEAELRKLSRVVEQIASAIVITNLEGTIEFVNPAFTRITGYTYQEAIGQNPRILKSGYHSSDFYQEMWATLRSGQVWQNEILNKCKDGTLYWESAVISPVRDQFGQITNYVAVKDDITVRKQTEQALRESEQKFRLLVETSTDVIWTVNTAQQFTYISPAIRQLRGLTPAEAMRETVMEAICPEFWPVAAAAAQRRAELEKTGERDIINRFEIQQPHQDGSRVWVEIITRTIYTAQGEPAGTLGISRNITDRKRAEDLLRRSEENLKKAQQIGNVGHWEYDLIRNSLFWSEQVFRIYGVSPNDFTPTYDQVVALSHPDDRQWVEDEFQKSIRNKTPFQAEYRIISPPGHLKYVVERASVQYDENGNPFSIIGSVLDITERKQAELALQQRSAQLEALRQIALELSAELELNTLLNSIAMQAGHLLASPTGEFYLYRPEQDILERVNQVVEGVQASLESITIRRGKGMTGKILESGQPLIVNDYQNWVEGIEVYKEAGLMAVVGVPVRWGDEFLGVLGVGRSGPSPFTQTDVELLQMFATHAALAIKNARLVEQTRQDAEIKARLLQEVNHRVKNNLAAIIGLLYAEQQHLHQVEAEMYESILQDLTRRVEGLATVHQMLSAAQWSPLPLDELTRQIINSCLPVVPSVSRVLVRVLGQPSPTLVPLAVVADQAHSMALIINELTTNTIKYAAGKQAVVHITVLITTEDNGETVRFEYRDDGPGYPEEVLYLGRRNVGLDLIENITRNNLDGDVTLLNDEGAVTVLRFKTVSIALSPKKAYH